MNEQSMLDHDANDFSGDCTYEGRNTYEDAIYTGLLAEIIRAAL
jgi:hypothetical protein